MTEDGRAGIKELRCNPTSGELFHAPKIQYYRQCHLFLLPLSTEVIKYGAVVVEGVYGEEVREGKGLTVLFSLSFSLSTMQQLQLHLPEGEGGFNQ